MSSSASSISSESSEEPIVRGSSSSQSKNEVLHRGFHSEHEPRVAEVDVQNSIPQGLSGETTTFVISKRPANIDGSSDTHTAFSGDRGPHLTRRSSDGRSREQQTISEFPRNDATLDRTIDSSEDDSRTKLVAVDRKRRLPETSPEAGRRRTVSGGFHNRQSSEQSIQQDESSSARGPPWPRRTDSIDHAQINFLDITGPPSSSSLPPLPPLPPPSPPSPPPPPPPPLSTAAPAGPAISATPSIPNRIQYALPRWQADSEVSECPICNRPFTFMFRRHHCRKCGRVVCNECSPHRITIPRQFIVHPPDANRTLTPQISGISGPIETIDLTGDGNSSYYTPTSPSSTSTANLTWAGGEKVRLCNPCVPDPQPNPQADFNISWPFNAGEDPWSRGIQDSANTNQTNRGSHTFSGIPRLSLASQSSLVGETSGHRNRGGNLLRDVDNFRNSRQAEAAPRYGVGGNTSIRDYNQRDRSFGVRVPFPANVFASQLNTQGVSSMPDPGAGLMHPGNPVIIPNYPPPPMRRQGGMPLPTHGHLRYQSLDTPPRSSPPTSHRPRIRSMLDVDPSLQQFIDQISASGSTQTPELPRPRLREEDICPICRHALPARGVDGDETAREAHIMDCIAARDPSTARSPPVRDESGSRQPTPPAPIHMLPFIASEKDCVAEDGSVQECSICMVEYDVGDQLARLECLCKFHRICIVEWFGRKTECPVHRMY